MLTASAKSWIGSRIGKYHILRELGRGGMGEVYLAEDTHLGREVALKRLLPIFAEDEDFVSRFKREARAISRLTHPGLVGVHSLDSVDGVLLLDMEYVRGTSLLRTLQDSVVTPQFTARLAQDLLEALVECHDHGIVHRDIKPSNILLTETHHAKLVDFGIATALADSTATQIQEGRSTTVVLGTPRFMPPEAWDGGEVSPQWDLFALGVVLYECLIGGPAYKGTTTAALARQITNDPLTPIAVRTSAVSPQLARLVDRLVLIKPEERCESARDALALLEGAPELQATPEGSTIRRSPQKSAKRALRKWGDSWSRSSLHSRTTIPLWIAGFLLTLTAGAIAVYLAMPRAATEKPDGSLKELAPVVSAAQSGPGDQFLRASVLGADDGNDWQWWIAAANRGQPRVVIGHSPVALLRMSMIETDDGARFEGKWAGFSSPLGRGFEQGPVTGGGRWEQGRRAMAATLKFESASQRVTREVGLLIEPDQQLRSREDYLRSLEASALIPTLLFREMLPRGLPMAQALNALLPSVRQRVVVPALNDGEPPVVNGRLDDAVWGQPAYDTSGRIGELTAPTGVRLMLRQGPKGLYLALRAPRGAESRITASFGLMIGVSNPPQWAPRGTYEVAGEEIADRKFFTGESEVPFPPGWELDTVQGVSDWTLEAFVPWDSHPNAPWRFNLRLQSSGPAETSSTLAAWGDPDSGELAHGALIQFENQGP